MRHHPSDCVRRNNRVGIDTDKEFRIADMLQPKIQCLCFAAILLAQDHNPAVGDFSAESTPRDFQRPIR